MLYFLPLRSCFSPVTSLKLKKKHGERGRFNMTSFDDICGHFGSVYLRVTLFSKCTHFLGIKVFETCTIKNTFLEISCQWWIPRLVFRYPRDLDVAGEVGFPFGKAKQEEMTDFVTDLRAKGWNVHDAQQEARIHVTLGEKWMCMSTGNFPIPLMVQKSG